MTKDANHPNPHSKQARQTTDLLSRDAGVVEYLTIVSQRKPSPVELVDAHLAAQPYFGTTPEKVLRRVSRVPLNDTTRGRLNRAVQVALIDQMESLRTENLGHPIRNIMSRLCDEHAELLIASRGQRSVNGKQPIDDILARVDSTTQDAVETFAALYVAFRADEDLPHVLPKDVEKIESRLREIDKKYFGGLIQAEVDKTAPGFNFTNPPIRLEQKPQVGIFREMFGIGPRQPKGPQGR